MWYDFVTELVSPLELITSLPAIVMHFHRRTSYFLAMLTLRHFGDSDGLHEYVRTGAATMSEGHVRSVLQKL